ncbi:MULTISPECIES: hypothetical protein [Bradyrhizobium]|uniref:hypothetical protein n=1 Tax=Bradyrhizobium elkanii TaxID=29448 RepID=UPI000419E2E1|nr:hypothetical protein [Bradyrhizobium elkanii]
MLEELQKLVDKACDSDRLFFERKRDRKHRIRRSHRAEILQNHLLSRGKFDSRLPSGLAWFTIVKCLCAGVRLRAFVPFVENAADTDLVPEAHCRELFEAMAERDPRIRQVELQLRAAACGEERL